MQIKQDKIAISLFRNLLYYMQMKGFSELDLLEKANINPEDIANPDIFIDRQLYCRLFDVCHQVTKDDNIGVHIGEYFKFSSLGIVGYMMENSSTVQEVFEKISKYNSLIGSGIVPEFHFKEKTFIIKYHVMETIDFFFDQQCVHSILAKVITGSRLVAGEQINPVAVYFKEKKPQDSSEYERIFNSQLVFNHDFDGIELNSSLLSMKILTADSEIKNHFERKAEALLVSEIKNSFIYKVKRHIICEHPGANVKIDKIASFFSMSVRTFQRKLKEENYSFKEIIDQIRKDIALDYMERKTLSISEISYIMGFSELSAFNRSFKRWTGQSPKYYRLNQNNTRVVNV